LRKLGKTNYAVPKAYCPIILLNTISKVINAVVAQRLSYLIKTYYVLLLTYIGRRKH
jgi:hypothetical protein